jgi:HD-GYP domain-containing protein (c-di-GMP phosphodiesterase class II)
VNARPSVPPADGVTALALVQRPSLSAGFCSQLRATLEDGEAAVNLLIRTYDADVADHHTAVADIALGIARRLGLAQDMARGIELASSIHDIGEIGIAGADRSFGRSGSRDPSADHPRAGASIVDGIRFPWPIAVMILQHHEHVDGSGYPDGVDGRSILIGSQVIAVADVVATRSVHVPSLAAALQLLGAGRGSLYDAEVIDACLALFPRSTGRLRPFTTYGP